MSDDIVLRLRSTGYRLNLAAAAEIERLRNEVKRLSGEDHVSKREVASSKRIPRQEVGNAPGVQV